MLQVAAVAAVGVAEGSSHLHWKKLFQILYWPFFGFITVLFFTAAFVAQGMYAPWTTSATVGQGSFGSSTARPEGTHGAAGVSKP
ncbi:hypothetical protein ABBQ38_006561 [Trebouxia sp. C0009 RCD-2024]